MKIGYLLYAPNTYLLYIVEGDLVKNKKQYKFTKKRDDIIVNTYPYAFGLNRRQCKISKQSIHALLKKYKDVDIFCYPSTIDKYKLSVVDGKPQTNLIEVNMEFNNIESIMEFEKLSLLDKTLTLYKKYYNIDNLSIFV